MDEDRVIFRRESLSRQKIDTNQVVDDVYLVKLATGIDDF